MTTDEQYVPDEEDVRTAYALEAARDTIGDTDYRAIPEARAEFDLFLARVRRDAKRCAIDELIADKAHVTVLLRAENGGNVEDVLTHYRDTHYPEETP